MGLNIGHPAGPSEAQEEALVGRTLANHAARTRERRASTAQPIPPYPDESKIDGN